MKQGKSRFDVLGQIGALRRYARSLTRNDADAEDLVQDTLVRAYEKRSSFRPDRNLRTWLMTILHNMFVDRIRSRQAETRRLDQAADASDGGIDPEQDHAVRLAQVRDAFLDLPEEQRAALHLVAIEGFSYAEAAVTLGVPIGTVMSRIARARTSLRAMEEGPEHHLGTPTLRIVGGSDDRTD
ncbi:RNA polymerase sigma-70 factor (ECF subfamily) [Rhodoligotrophos appendicifer]|uniref:sigma-70 family RNA polymerase sigma factor n=1 Tax=Rhodoligotrophos appendicifer TaxID=987056 RepID=UPI00117ED929|nr:sigma-70 family RNA polymerase sigma factor [Rhodoligotrophos appendicifer]